MILNLSWVLISLGLLYGGAVWLVRGSASAALRLGISPLMVGLTIVDCGTSTPELLVSAKAAWTGHGDLALGNVIGSNIFNTGVILGLAAVVCPLRVQFQLLRLDAPVMLLVAVAFWGFFRDALISRAEAAVFCAGLATYTLLQVSLARREANATVEQEFNEAVPPASRHWGLDVALIVCGLGLLLAGSRLLVENAAALARGWGVREAVIGLTIVAAGTSMPELATSVVAAWRKQADIAVGNVVGSNIFNILAILGLSGLLTPLAGPEIRSVEVYVMLVLTAILVPLLWSGLTVKRWEGALLLSCYGLYLVLIWPD